MLRRAFGTVLTLAALSACQESQAPAISNKPRLTSLSFDRDTATLVIGDTLTTKVSVVNSVGVAVDTTVAYQSSAPQVARVDDQGRVIAVAAGSATITASVAELNDELQVTVARPTIVDVAFSADTATLYLDELWPSVLIVRDARQKIVRNPEVALTSSDSSVASIDQTGQLRATRVGTARIVVTSGALADTLRVTVVPHFTQLSTGTVHTCGITGKAQLYCWGADLVGELGAATPGACPPTAPFSPQQCSLVPIPVKEGDRFVSVTAGGYHTCALTRAGEAYCWGGNFYGQLGNGTSNGTSGTQPSSPTPMLVSGSLQFKSLHAARLYTCGITVSGSAYCWGPDGSGQLGLGTTAPERCSIGTSAPPCSTTPALVVGGHSFAEIVAGGDAFTCGRTTAGTVYCWGESVGGVDLISRTPILQAGGRTFTALAVTSGAICGREATGALTCWRYNRNGEFGNGTTDALLATAPVVGAGGRLFDVYSGAASHMCALDSGGIAWCWGSNAEGRLGDGTTTSRYSPSRVATALVFTRLAPSAFTSSTCAIATTGRAYCWGMGWYGQLGTGEFGSSTTPVLVRLVR